MGSHYRRPRRERNKSGYRYASKRMQLEERIYRHRCVEAWAITVPWTGFPMRALLDYARPRAGAKYVVMEAFEDQEIAPGQRQFWSYGHTARR